MSQSAVYSAPLFGPLVRLLTNRWAPLALVVVLALAVLVYATVLFGPVVITLTAVALVPVMFVILIAIAGH